VGKLEFKNLHTEVKKVSYIFSKIGWSWTSTGTKLQQENMKTVQSPVQSSGNESGQAAILVMKRMLVTNCDVRYQFDI